MGYAKYYNKKYNRSGSLFRKGFRHKEVTDKLYLQALIAYINRNPMHHGYKVDYRKYEWSSYSIDYEKFLPMELISKNGEQYMAMLMPTSITTRTSMFRNM